METRKKGISLIVLVITIIVMIILAAAIILSISNSGIIGKANKAKEDSDTASLKEYVNVLEAEWELMSEEEKGKTECSSSTEYVNKKLGEKGYEDITYSADGEFYSDLPNMTKEVLSKGIKIGDVVDYTVADANVPSEAEDNGTHQQTISNLNQELIWVYIGVGEKGELLIAPDVSKGVHTESIMLQGSVGWSNGPNELKRICDELYTVSGRGKARSIKIEDIDRLLGYTGEQYLYEIDDVSTPTNGLKTISQIMSEIEYESNKFNTSGPESGKAVGDYPSHTYSIDKEKDVEKMKYPENIKYVFPSSGSYFLATNDVIGVFNTSAGWAQFGIVNVSASSVESATLVLTLGGGILQCSSLQPIVELESKITKNDARDVWEFEG